MFLNQKFGRRILGAFTALTALVLIIATNSIVSLRSVVSVKDAVVSGAVQRVMDSDRLAQAHQARTAEIRGYLLSRERIHLSAIENARREFDDKLNELLDQRPENAAIHDLLLQLRTLESGYTSLLRQAFHDSRRTNWILENQVRPTRVRLETSLARLNSLYRDELSQAISASSSRANDAIRLMKSMLVATAVLLAALGYLVYGLLREEQQAMAAARESRDILAMARQRTALLASAGKVFSEESDPQKALSLIAERAVEWLADLFLVELSGKQGPLDAFALATSNSAKGNLLKAFHSSLRDGLAPLFGSASILESAQPQLHQKITDARLAGLGVNSYIGVPLRAHGHTLGLLLLIRTGSNATYTTSDLQFAQELGHQTALALDNSRLLQQAQSGLKMREDLLATVAHDLRNPLAVIRMRAEVGMKNTEENEQSRASYASIHDSSLQMERLINDLLELTKIEAGRVVIERNPHDAHNLIEDCVTSFEPQARAKSIELLRDARPGECIVSCDRNRVQQILSNLVANAIKFTPHGGRISIDARATGEGIRFSVIDTGPGIPPEQLPHVFDKYWQARRSGSKGGTGLGLSIARGLVEAHGGRIWAESALNFGSRFFFTLPEARHFGTTVKPKAA